MQSSKGLTFMVVFGKWAKPHFRFGKGTYGICLGWMAISFVTLDIEVLSSNALKKIKDLEKQLNNLK